MADLTGLGAVMSLQARGKHGAYSRFLRGELTWEECLALDPYAGIYQIQKINGKRTQIKLRFYKPSNPRTVEQMSWRGTFADGVALWQSLTHDEKDGYNIEARTIKMSGFNLFMREWLRQAV